MRDVQNQPQEGRNFKEREEATKTPLSMPFDQHSLIMVLFPSAICPNASICIFAVVQVHLTSSRQLAIVSSFHNVLVCRLCTCACAAVVAFGAHAELDFLLLSLFTFPVVSFTLALSVTLLAHLACSSIADIRPASL